MSDAAVARHLGFEPGALGERYPGTAVIPHAWWDPATLVEVGTISAGRVETLSAAGSAAACRSVSTGRCSATI
jgi:hypothetical protein